MEMRAARRRNAQSDLAAEIERRNQVMKGNSPSHARCEFRLRRSLASAPAVSTVTNHEDELNLLRSELGGFSGGKRMRIFSAVKVAAEGQGRRKVEGEPSPVAAICRERTRRNHREI